MTTAAGDGVVVAAVLVMLAPSARTPMLASCSTTALAATHRRWKAALHLLCVHQCVCV